MVTVTGDKEVAQKGGTWAIHAHGTPRSPEHLWVPLSIIESKQCWLHG